MRHAFQTPRIIRATCSALFALTVTAGSAMAGGFDVREQSTYFQGMSFAGAAAGGSSLSSMFWNPAAAGYAQDGLSFESSLSLIIPRADVTVEAVRPNGLHLAG